MSDAVQFSRSGNGLRLSYGLLGSYLTKRSPLAHEGDHLALGLPRFLSIESRISLRWALWTSRSRMPSASVGSPHFCVLAVLECIAVGREKRRAAVHRNG